MKNSSIFRVTLGTYGGFGRLSFILKNGKKGLGFEDTSLTFFLRSSISFEIFFNSLATLSRSSGFFLEGLFNSKGFFPVNLVSSNVGWIYKEINCFLITLTSSKLWAKETLPAHLRNMHIDGSNTKL
jgi:hypothetical protein